MLFEMKNKKVREKVRKTFFKIEKQKIIPRKNFTLKSKFIASS